MEKKKNKKVDEYVCQECAETFKASEMMSVDADSQIMHRFIVCTKCAETYPPERVAPFSKPKRKGVK